MKVVFLGTGEAFGRKENTSMLINDEILLECGFHTLKQLMKVGKMDIKIVYLSHFHADHSIGLSSLLIAMNEEGRNEKLTILAPKGIEDYVKNLLKISYGKNIDDLNYEIEMVEIGKKINMFGYEFLFGKTRHSFDCYSVSISKNKKIAYTGDGFPTKATLNIAKSSDLLIAEAYGMFKNHSSIVKAAELAKEAEASILALVHIFRKEDVDKEMKKAEKIFTPILIPKEFDEIWI